MPFPIIHKRIQQTKQKLIYICKKTEKLNPTKSNCLKNQKAKMVHNKQTKYKNFN